MTGLNKLIICLVPQSENRKNIRHVFLPSLNNKKNPNHKTSHTNIRHLKERGLNVLMKIFYVPSLN